jgi:ribosomal protein S18 acetylase RimI-like enzyme
LSASVVRTLTVAEQDRALATLALAFSADPIERWFMPEPHTYLTYFLPLNRAFGGRAFEHGSAYGVEGFLGIALWLPPGVSPDREAMGAILAEAPPGPDAEEASAFMEQMASYHPSEPHWYLPLIGVDPAHHGQGYGSALLQPALETIDRQGSLAYLECTNPRNVPLYERHGFESMGVIQTVSSPPMRPMLRRPRG